MTPPPSEGVTTMNKKAIRGVTSVEILKTDLVRVHALAAQHALTNRDTIAMLLDTLDNLQRAGIKLKRYPARTELEFPR